MWPPLRLFRCRVGAASGRADPLRAALHLARRRPRRIHDVYATNKATLLAIWVRFQGRRRHTKEVIAVVSQASRPLRLHASSFNHVMRLHNRGFLVLVLTGDLAQLNFVCRLTRAMVKDRKCRIITCCGFGTFSSSRSHPLLAKGLQWQDGMVLGPCRRDGLCPSDR